MRKATIIIGILLILTLGTTCFAAVKIYDSRDKVTLTEVTAWGNKASMQDLTMQMNIMYRDRLHWNTRIPMSNPEEAVTKYDFSITPVYEELDKDGGLGMTTSIDTSLVQDDIMQGKAEGIAKAYMELADTIGPNEEAEKKIYLKDYMDYYQYMIQLDIPGSEIYGWKSWYQSEPINYVIKKINDFFKIPVLENECHSISIGKNDHGSIYHTGSGNGESDFFNMWIFNAIGNDALYFTFDTRSRDGVVVDTSLIPGGYGIYKLPFDHTLAGNEENADTDKISADADGLEMVHSLDPQINVMHLHLNENKDKLILHAEENGKYVVTIMDIATMNTLQKIEVMDWDKAYYGCQIYEEDDFFVNIVHKQKEEWKIEAAVFAENENGEYEIAFISEVQNMETPWFNTTNMYLDFDGIRLAMAGFLEEEKQYGRQTCNVFAAVCDASGLQYYGEYRNSLETGYDPDSYSYHCQEEGEESIVLEWKEY